jgi:ABC-type multidrug transport system ATPase subunit
LKPTSSSPQSGTMIMDDKGYGLSFWIKSYTIEGKEILHDVRGFVAPGEVLALMGPSGAGKTTLLDVLAHRHTGSVFGTVLVNGQDLGANIRYACAFVPQNDQALLGILTVQQTMTFASSFAVPSKYSLQEKADRVDNMIKGLGLYRVRNSKVGTTLFRGISGGEKRRCSVGTQLLSDKPILFLDEPTSGLDSYSAEKLIRDVKKLAKERNLSVICTVHQPNQKTLNHFDRLLFLSHGHQVWFGPAQRCIQHFQKLNILPQPFKGNLAEAVMDEVNIDFDLAEGRDRREELERLVTNPERNRVPKKLEKKMCRLHVLFRAFVLARTFGDDQRGDLPPRLCPLHLDQRLAPSPTIFNIASARSIHLLGASLIDHHDGLFSRFHFLPSR